MLDCVSFSSELQSNVCDDPFDAKACSTYFQPSGYAAHQEPFNEELNQVNRSLDHSMHAGTASSTVQVLLTPSW